MGVLYFIWSGGLVGLGVILAQALVLEVVGKSLIRTYFKEKRSLIKNMSMESEGGEI
jgi:hypothetical protein